LKEAGKTVRRVFQKEGDRVNGSILILDDDEAVLEALSDVLWDEGYWVETAQTGKEGIRKAREWFFDIALIDVALPDMSGITVLQIFQLKYPTMIKMMLSEYTDLHYAVDAVNIGANAYILKPINPEGLSQLIGYKELVNISP
jgi:DNA-binding NtrC family response regulator